MIKFFILFIATMYNYQKKSNLRNLFSDTFFETSSFIPSHTKYSFLDLSTKYILLAPGLNISYNNLNIGISIIIKRGDSILYPRKLWNNLFAADYNALFLEYKHNPFNFAIGRIPIKWSVSPISSMIFPGYEPGLDVIYYGIQNKKVSFDYFFSTVYDDEPMRYLAAHRILLKPFKNLQIGFKDIILYKTKTGEIDFYYFNPLAIYYLRQWSIDSSGFTNSIFDFTGELILGDLHFYGELLIDDFPYVKLYHENPRMGILFGGAWKSNRYAALLEYVRINRFTYCYYTFAPYMGYKYFDIPMGHPEGNDFDVITLLLLKKIGEREAGFTLSYSRHGEGTLDEVYRSTSEESEDYFLSGIIEKTLRINYFISTKLLNLFKMQISISHCIIHNYSNTSGLTKNKTDFNLTLKLLSK